MNRLSAFLDRMWFPAMPATRLAFLRIAVGLFSFWYVAQRYDMYRKVAASDRFFFDPVGIVGWMAQPLSAGAFEALLILTLLSNVAFIAGWRHRFTGPLFGLSLLTLLCYRNSWTMIYHNDNALAVHALILGFTASADAWSLDAWRARRSSSNTGPLVHWRYGWAVQLMCAATAATYFLAGIAKVAGELGWNWVSGEALRGQVAADAIRKSLLGETGSDLAFVLYDHLWLFTLIGVVSMIVELGAPLVMLDRRVGMLWAVNAFFMHWGIFFIMSITFRYQMAGFIFLAFFPVEQAVSFVAGIFRRRWDSPLLRAATGGAR